MRLLLSVTPLIVAFLLSSCGPGISGEGQDRSRYMGQVLSMDGLIFYARMDEERGAISDFYGRAIGAAQGFPLYAQTGGLQSFDGINKAIQFDNSTACFNFGSLDALNLQRPFSISLMVDTYSIGPHTLIGNWGTTGNHSWRVMVTAGPNLRFDWSDDGTTLNPFGNNETFGIGFPQWYHFVITVDVFGNTNLYLDGGFSNNVNGLVGDIYHSPNGISIGCNSDGTGEYHNGAIDEIAIFNRELNSNEVFELYQARF